MFAVNGLGDLDDFLTSGRGSNVGLGGLDDLKRSVGLHF
jgi:hypothetical protein